MKNTGHGGESCGFLAVALPEEEGPSVSCDYFMSFFFLLAIRFYPITFWGGGVDGA